MLWFHSGTYIVHVETWTDSTHYIVQVPTFGSIAGVESPEKHCKGLLKDNLVAELMELLVVEALTPLL
jgi:hypothetical protein